MAVATEAWLCVLRDAEGNQETELVAIERSVGGGPPLIELTNGVRVTCTQPATANAAGAESAAAWVTHLSKLGGMRLAAHRA
jgi:hypothetical protein